jgi:hypothetical protein
MELVNSGYEKGVFYVIISVVQGSFFFQTFTVDPVNAESILCYFIDVTEPCAAFQVWQRMQILN